MSYIHGLKFNLDTATLEQSFIYLVEVVCHFYVNPLLPVVIACVS